MAQIVNIDRARHLALPMFPLAKNVRHLTDPTALPTPQYFDQYLVAQRMKIDALDGAAPNHEITAHGVRHPAHHPRQDNQTDELRAARNEASENAPIADAPAFDVARGDRDVCATVHDLAQIQRNFRRMLKIRIDDCQNVPSSGLPTPDHGRGQTPL